MCGNHQAEYVPSINQIDEDDRHRVGPRITAASHCYIRPIAQADLGEGEPSSETSQDGSGDTRTLSCASL